jgi:hypothetical protein
MVQILMVHLDPPAANESDISSVRWYNPEDGQISLATRSVMVDFIRGGGAVYAFDGRNRSEVEVAEGLPAPYIRVRPGSAIGSLLALPKF